MRTPQVDTAFVLGGGGLHGAAEVGMLQALVAADITPDLVVGTSVGAINGAAVAADPSPGAMSRLARMWSSETVAEAFAASVLRRVSTLALTRTHMHGNSALRRLLAAHMGERRIEDLPTPFECAAASIERAAEHWFTEGPLIDAVLASCAVPGLLPPVALDGEHFIDGGIVNSIPLSRALRRGARRVFVCHVGRIDDPLRPPRTLWEVGLVAFEVARRHRFHADMAAIPEGVRVHVMPTGGGGAPPYDSLAQLRYRDTSRVSLRIERARRASERFLASLP
ncbi:MAG: patatin-like phospholipase family protein [Candidatus Dormibacteria bacterium]